MRTSAFSLRALTAFVFACGLMAGVFGLAGCDDSTSTVITLPDGDTEVEGADNEKDDEGATCSGSCLDVLPSSCQGTKLCECRDNAWTLTDCAALCSEKGGKNPGCVSYEQGGAACSCELATPDGDESEAGEEQESELAEHDEAADTEESEADHDPDHDAEHIEADEEADSTEVEIDSQDWSATRIASAKAPIRTQVVAVLDTPPAPELAALREAYGVTQGQSALAVKSAAYDATTRTVTLTTDPQKLGLTYTLKIAGGGQDGQTASFLSADKHTFWTTDFSSANYDQVQTVALRIAVRDNAVLYAQEGYDVSSAEALLEEFDTTIYPTLTGFMRPAPDIDGNGKVVILGLDGAEYYGGYFSPTNQYPDSDTMSWWGQHSNEMEIVHVNVLTDASYLGQVTAHEFQHMLYHDLHGLQQDYFEYHDEGLAECAIHLVYGSNDYAVQFYAWDPKDLIRNGLSLVNWNYGEYANYAQAYFFWTYLTGQLSGDTTGYKDIFLLPDGRPSTVNTFIQNRLGLPFHEAYQQALMAYRVQADSGLLSLNGLLAFQPSALKTVTTGTKSLELLPYGGAFFKLPAGSVNYPGTQGAHIVYRGLKKDGTQDTEAPFALDSDSLLLVYNANTTYNAAAETSGPDVAAQKRLAAPAPQSRPDERPISPPPYYPNHPQNWQAWRFATFLRLGK